jgi:hypothetical protein
MRIISGKGLARVAGILFVAVLQAAAQSVAGGDPARWTWGLILGAAGVVLIVCALFQGVTHL